MYGKPLVSLSQVSVEFRDHYSVTDHHWDLRLWTVIVSETHRSKSSLFLGYYNLVSTPKSKPLVPCNITAEVRYPTSHGVVEHEITRWYKGSSPFVPWSQQTGHPTHKVGSVTKQRDPVHHGKVESGSYTSTSRTGFIVKKSTDTRRNRTRFSYTNETRQVRGKWTLRPTVKSNPCPHVSVRPVVSMEKVTPSNDEVESVIPQLILSTPCGSMTKGSSFPVRK